MILNLRLKEDREVDAAVQYFTELIQKAAWQATLIKNVRTQKDLNVPLHIRELVIDKRSARKRWQRSRNIQDKTYLNRLTHRLGGALLESRNEPF